MGTFKTYFRTLEVIAFLVANYFAARFAFAGLNRPSDATFVIGMVGVAFIAVTDFFIIHHVVVLIEKTQTCHKIIEAFHQEKTK